MAITSATDAAALSSSTDSRARLSDNYDTFLLLLTAQLQNQDPLSPMDSTQFTEQLVQYSQVEQQIRTNDQLESLTAHFQAASAGAALGYLGKFAVIEGSNAELRDGAATWAYTLDEAAKSVTLQVKNSAGKVVFQTNGDPAAGDHSFIWNGKDSDGNELAEGGYTLSVVAKDAAGDSLKPTVMGREEIMGVDFSGSSPLVITRSGTKEMAKIRAILEDS